MVKRILLVLSFVVMLFVLSACDGGRVINISRTDAGKEVKLDVGDTLVIELDGNITTGYSWVIDSVDSEVLEILGEPEYTGESKLPGAPGVFKIQLKAIGTGETKLVLNYLRPWEVDVDPIDTFEVLVIVQ